MELELGLKVTRTREDVSSSVDFRFSKDPFGPLVLSRETDWRFIIIIHLKGFKKEGIEIEINEEGNRITIKGRKPVEELVLIRWMAWRKEVEFRFFSKVFRIPDFVDLDRIKAKFDDDDTTLTITMPKRVKGISGFKIEEDEEERMELGDVSEAEHKEDEKNKGDAEEQNREREESGEHSGKFKTEIQKQEELGEIRLQKERESEGLGEEHKGFSVGLEEEERDVSEAENKEEEIHKGDVEEQSREREESDEHSGKSETEIQKHKERENEVLGEKQKGFIGVLDEEERDMSEHKEEEINKGEVEEQSRNSEESDEHSAKSETEIQKQEECGEIIQHKERESEFLREEQKGFNEEERDVKTEHKEEDIDKGEIEEHSSKRKESDEHSGKSETEIQKQEEFGEIIKDKERESEVMGEEQKGLRGGLVKDRDVSEAGHKEEEIEKGEVEQNREREESDGNSAKYETEIQKQEEYGEVIQHKERESEVLGEEQKSFSGGVEEDEEEEEEEEKFDKGEVEKQSREKDESDEPSAKYETEIRKHTERDSQVLGEKQKGFSGGLDEEEAKDDNLKMTQQIDNQDQILDCVEEDKEEKKGLQELTDINKESEESNLRKLPDVEGRDPHEQTRDEEQELVKEQEEETKSDDFGSRTFEENEEQEPDVSDRTCKSRAMEKDMTDDNGLRKVQEIEEPERCNEESKFHEIVEGETSDQEKKQFVKMEIIDKDAKEVVDGKTGEGSQVPRKDDIAETETKVEEFESDKLEADEVEETHELVEKKEDEGENSKVRRESEDRSLIKLQESEEKLSKGQELLRRNEKIKQVVEEKTPEENTNIGCDILKPVQEIKVPEVDTLGETGDAGKERKENNKVETGDVKVQVDVKMGERFGPDIAETETKAEEFEYDKQKADEVDKIAKLVEEKAEEKDEQVPEAEVNVGNDTVNPFQEKYKCQKNFQEQTKNQPEEYKENVLATKEKINDTAVRKVQETIRQQEMDEAAGCEKESNTQEMVKSKTNDGKMGEGFRPHIEETQVLGKDDIEETERKVGEFESDKIEADEVDKMNEWIEKKEDEGENSKVGRRSEGKSLIKLQESEEQKSMGQKQHRRHEMIKELVKEKTPEVKTNIGDDNPKPVQEIEVPKVDTLEETGYEEKIEENKKAATGDAKVLVDARMAERFAPNIAETETKAEEFIYDKEKADEVDKSHKLLEEKVEEKDNAKVGTKSEDISLTKLPEIEEQQIQGQKRHEKPDKIKGLVEEQVPEAVTKNQPEEYKDKIVETRENINDAGARKVKELIRLQMLDEPARGEKEIKTRELMKSKMNDEDKKEKEFAETETKEQESYRPKTLREPEKAEELAEEKTNFSKERRAKEEEEIAKKRTEFGDNDDISSNIPGIEQRDLDAMKGKEEKLLEEKVCDGGRGIIAVAEMKAENDKSHKIEESEEQESLEGDTCTEKFQKLIGGETSIHEEVEDVKKEKNITEAEKGIHRKRGLDVTGKHIKGTTIQELEKNTGIYRSEHADEKKDEADRPEKIPGTVEQEFYNLNGHLEQDKFEDGEKTQLVGEIIKDCDKEVGSEESKTKTVDDDVVRKVSGIKEKELYEPKREHVSMITGLVEEKTGDHDNQEEKEIVQSEIEAEYGGLRKVKGIKEQELHEPEIHKERDKNRTEEPILLEKEKEVPSFQEEEKEEPSGEEEENIVEPTKITESENFVDDHEIKKERPDKLEKNEKSCNIPGMVEAGHKDRKEEEQEEKEMERVELQNVEESSKSVKEIEEQEYDDVKRSTTQDKMQEKDKTRTMEENDIVEREKTKGLRKVRDDEDLELSRPYKRQKDDKSQELVEMGTSDYREKVKNQEENDILRIPETVTPNLDEYERHDEQSNIPQLVEEEAVGSISELGKKIEDDSSGKFHELKEEKSYENWTHEEQEKRKDLVKEEATDPKDKHTGGEDNEEGQQEEKIITKAEPKTEEDSSIKVHEIDQQENDELKRSIVQDKIQETEEKDKTLAMEENEIVERRTETKDGSLEKVPDSEYSELGRDERHGEEDGIQELVETGISDHREGDSSGKFQKPKSYEDWKQEGNEETTKSVKGAADLKDKYTGKGEGEDEEGEEKYEKVAQTEMKTTIEDESNKNTVENKEPESDKEERYRKQDELIGVLREEESDRGKEKSQELKVQEKTDIVLDYVEDVAGVQEDEKAEEAADEVAWSENGSLREVQRTKEDELEKSEEDMEQNKISETYDPEVTEEDEERVAEEETKEEVPKSRNVRETKELEADVQENEGETENCRDEGREEMRVETDKQGKTNETVPHERFKTKGEDGIQRKIQDTKMEESNEKRSTIEEVERKKLVTKDESLGKGQEILEKKSNVSKRRPVEQEKIREPEEVIKCDRVYKDEVIAEDKREIDDGQSRKSKMLELDEREEQKKIQKLMEEKSNAPDIEEEGNKEPAEEEIRDTIDSRVKDQEPYELLKNEEHDKIPECHREGEKTMEQRVIEMIMRTTEDVNSKKIQQIKAQESDGLEEHQKLSEKQQGEEEEVDEGGGNKEKLQTKPVASNESRDAEEKGSDQTKMFAEQEKVQELMPEEAEKEEYHIREREQKEKTKSVPQVESKASDDNSEKETKGQELTGLRVKKKNGNHQELVEMKRSDQRKEEKEEEIDGQAETIVEHDNMNKKLAEEGTSDDKEAKEGTRAGKVLGDVSETQEQDEMQSFVDKDTSDKAKDSKSQHTYGRDDSSRKTHENEKQKSHEKKRNEEQDKKTLTFVGKETKYCRNEEEDNEIKEAAEAEVPRKLQGNEERESTKMVERHEIQDDIKQLVEKKLKKQDGEDQKSTEVLEGGESMGPEGLRRKDNSREKSLRDNHEDEETGRIEPKSKNIESGKIQQIKEEEKSELERLKEQGRIKESMKDRSYYSKEKENRETECEDGSSKKIQDKDKEDSIEPERDEKRDKIQETVNKETSIDDEEELEIEFEEEEEDWETEIIQETDSDEENDKIRKINRIRFGFRLVGGSTLFMSFIVIVIHFIHSKKKIRYYKF